MQRLNDGMVNNGKSLQMKQGHSEVNTQSMQLNAQVAGPYSDTAQLTVQHPEPEHRPVNFETHPQLALPTHREQHCPPLLAILFGEQYQQRTLSFCPRFELQIQQGYPGIWTDHFVQTAWGPLMNIMPCGPYCWPDLVVSGQAEPGIFCPLREWRLC